MVKLVVPNDIINDTPANASPVEQNFNRIEAYINTDSIERNGSVAMSAQLKLVGNPVAPLDAAPKQYVDAFLPIGIIMMFGGTGAPPGGKWAECNGAELESAIYPDLYAVIGSRYSVAGVPAGRFNLPSLGGRVPLGASASDEVGKQGGGRDAVVVTHGHTLENHTHTMKNHVHHFNHYHAIGGTTGAMDRSGNHAHGFPEGYFIHVTANPQYYVHVTGGGGFDIGADTFNFATWTTATGGAVDHLHPLPANTAWLNSAGSGGVGGGNGGDGNTYGPNDNTTDLATGHNAVAAGVSGADANLPPYLAVTYIMRVS